MPSVVPSLERPQPLKQRNGMLVYRAICAVLVAWAMNWVMGQPVADNLLELVPEMAYMTPLAGALVGFFALSKRQGWGFIVAVANGFWTMLLTVAGTWLIFLTVTLFGHVAHGLVADFENFLRILAQETAPLAEGWVDLWLAGMTLGASVVVAVVTEILYWILLLVRRARGYDDEEEEDTETA